MNASEEVFTCLNYMLTDFVLRYWCMSN